jgi:hypothetical protein
VTQSRDACMLNVQPSKVSLAERILDVQMRDAFLMDFENRCLAEWDARQGIPKGPKRYQDEAWATHVLDFLRFSDTSWSEYCQFVIEGGGDEWFVEE